MLLEMYSIKTMWNTWRDLWTNIFYIVIYNIKKKQEKLILFKHRLVKEGMGCQNNEISYSLFFLIQQVFIKHHLYEKF